MSLSRNIWKWIGYTAATVVAVPILFVILVTVIMMIAQRSRTLYTITDKGYEFEVLYYPGGGAVGSSHELEVRVTGGKWDDDELIRVDAADSADVQFVRDSVAMIRVFRRYSRDPKDSDWRCVDSLLIDLAKSRP